MLQPSRVKGTAGIAPSCVFGRSLSFSPFIMRKSFFQYHTILERILYEALKTVNKELISLYWDIGRMIVERQKGKTWGKAVVERLAKDLQAEFPGMQGFSAANLWRTKHFHETYANKEKL